MNSLVKMAVAAATLTYLTGCASILNGTHQQVTVKTPPVEHARCTLTNSNGEWEVSDTPASVKIHRDYNDLNISCSKPGYQTARKTVISKTKAPVFGNVVLGGVVGAGVDMVNGAAYAYPETISVPMHKG
ncbi:MAG: lipoprotein [Gammaproteobacteria bacterium]